MFCFGRYSYLNQRSVRHFGLIINLINYVFVTSCTSGIKHSKLLLNTHQLSPTVFAMCSRHQRQMRDLFLMCSRYQSYLSCLFERLQRFWQCRLFGLLRFWPNKSSKYWKIKTRRTRKKYKSSEALVFLKYLTVKKSRLNRQYWRSV